MATNEDLSVPDRGTRFLAAPVTGAVCLPIYVYWRHTDEAATLRKPHDAHDLRANR
jgi:hypothetical protein